MWSGTRQEFLVRKRSIRQTGRSEGFSLLELLVVVGITMVLAALATPRVANTLAAYRLRQSSVQLAGLIQQGRMAAVRSNIPVEIRPLMIQSGTRQEIYVDLPGANGAAPNGQWDAGEPVTILPRGVTIQTSGFPGDAYAVAVPNLSAQAQGTPVKFSPRGLPCVVLSGVCKNLNGTTQIGFVYYLRSDALLGGNSWAAVTITPAGRIKPWYYYGGTYQ
jgi:Tfp pilus assembly protein FimT